jgi:BirA family transcriptional regulator, biotin operon repressor / biotin---[acetyl-CoA-carboxylase] ligase
MEKAIGSPFVKTAVIELVLESTNDRAIELVREGSTELPLLVWAKGQSRGRGRGDRLWWSDSGSLTFTVAIDPAAHSLAVEHEPRLALATAVAVIAALGDLELATPSIGIRWPNDVEADGLKLGGILPERLDTQWGRRLVMGVGLNVRTNLAEAPAEVRAMATSLEALRGESIEQEVLPRLLVAILSRFQSVLHLLAADDPGLAAEWGRLDQLRDRQVRVDLGTSILAGLGRGIDAEGALCLEVGAQTTRLFGGRVVRE